MIPYNELCAQLRGRWRKNVPMKDQTTMRVGGPADLMVHPADARELSMVISWLNTRNIYYFILGSGTNLIVRDGGIRGVVINMRDSFNYFKVYDQKIVSGAGTGIATLSAVSLQAQLTGLEFAIGIPGSLGGAIKMNAGAFNHSIGDVLKWVKTIDPEGFIKIIEEKDLSAGYRESCVDPRDIVIEAELELKKEQPEKIREKVEFFRDWRKSHQPAKVHSAGCIFKNPPEGHAGKLLDELGLKGYQYGDAVVSDVHANFIINRGNATAKDILILIEKIQEILREKKGIELVREVQVIGED